MAERGYQYGAAQGCRAIPLRGRDEAAQLAQAGGRLPKQPRRFFGIG